ncbi:hypothetical protein [Streptomyces candidus]|uniref:Uncharacterized protein n=1 Tax=Streptomyces candidus TaxID=67283 RepID=A0A7X0HKK2_9ACTN|nr:hypothetical protein [Streptomyces candidus]MBB6437873.1 hypothetical protein [Streptomyces candidus]GHH49915.1 hypothetical protein GCM10018773_46020 [Streptomyces candidus]
MPEPEFSVLGVRIERWTRSLTRAGQVIVRDGTLSLLRSDGALIDSAPLDAVTTGRPWFAGDGRLVARLNGTRYSLTAPEPGDGLLETLRGAHG